jgi:hypothetical protein
MPKRNTKVKKNSRRRRQSGGAGGLGWTPGAPLTGLGDGLVENKAYDTCLSTARHGQSAFQYTGGLPGMRGGAYTNNLNSNLNGFAQVDKLGCTPNHVNPLNRQSGGAGNMAASSSPVLTEVGARYTGTPSQWTGSTGSPVWINQPLSGAAWSKACTQTAGRRRNKKNRNTRRRR